MWKNIIKVEIDLFLYVY
uniref:Uncharacterized protein n=1 Tax=Rhizophora mucronata TaxID=61149 RepID=A0A2P2PGX0_RHIMU